MEIKLDQVQLVLFSPGIIIVDKLKMANDLNNNLSGLFDGEPVILPLPDEAPPEISRIQITSKDGRNNLSIAKSRLDFVFRYREEDQKQVFPIPGLFEKFLAIFKYFKEEVHALITRTAVVTEWIINLDENAAAEIMLLKYMRADTLIIKPNRLEIHYLNKESVAGYEVNKWTRIKSAQEISAPKPNKLIFHMDINTVIEKSYDIAYPSLDKFLKECSQVMTSDLEAHLKIIRR